MERADSWDEAVATLTNGQDDAIFLASGIVNGAGGGGGGNESSVLDGGLTGEWDPDFAGATLTRVMLRVDSVTIDSPGDDPNNDGVWTDYSIRSRVIFYGRR